MAKAPRKPKAKSTAPKKPSLDIFDEMRAADKQDLTWLDRQPEELAKTFAAVVAMRWFSTVGDNTGFAPYHLLMTNEMVNVGFWELSKHPELQWRLMAACGLGSVQRHQWIAGSKRKNTNKLDAFLLGLYPHINDDEIAILKSRFTRDTLKQLLKDTGMPDAEMKPLLDDLKKLG